MNCHGIATVIRGHLKQFGKVEPLGEDYNGGGDFAAGCDNYEAWAFCLENNGRTYYVMVEDVTIKKDD